MKNRTHNSKIDVRRPGQTLDVSTGRRVWSLNFQ
jgi:hypothetical protein